MNPPITDSIYNSCTLCPRMCRVDRRRHTGFCGCTDTLTAARAGLHHWEEPCLSGTPGRPGGSGAPGQPCPTAAPGQPNITAAPGQPCPTAAPGHPSPSAPSTQPGGSGAIFFSGCTLGCCFCQNHRISREHFGKALTPRRLAQILLTLQDQGALNINLVTATQFLPQILEALHQVKHRLTIPVIYNSGGYERVETVTALKDYVDIWLPDFKYFDNRLAARYSSAPDYFETAAAAIGQMINQTGPPVYVPQNPQSTAASSTPLLKKGVIIRHLVLPSHKQDSMALLNWISGHFPRDQYLVSLMSQYTPYIHNADWPHLNRRITSYEYYQVVDEAIRLGLTRGFMQEKSSAREEYTPPFDLEGL